MALQTCMTDSQFWWLGQLKFDQTFFLQYMLALSLRISVSTPSPAVNHNANCLVFLWATCLLLWHLIHQRWTAPPRTSGKVRQPMLVTWSFEIWSNLFSTVHACIIFENLSFYPISCCQHFLNKPPSFFHKVPSNLITMCLPGSLRVLWEFMGKLSHIESLLWVHYKEPSGHILIKLMGTLWKNSKGSFTKYPLGTLWTLCERTKGVCSKSTHWVYCPLPPVNSGWLARSRKTRKGGGLDERLQSLDIQIVVETYSEVSKSSGLFPCLKRVNEE